MSRKTTNPRKNSLPTKICKICKIEKSRLGEFYISKGVARGECKKCTIKKHRQHNIAHEGAGRFASMDDKRAYSREYYASHIEEFREYRRTFKEKKQSYGSKKNEDS